MGKSQDKDKMRIHKNPLHSHFYDAILDTYGHRRRVDDHSSISRQICSSCGRNPECLTLKSPDDANITEGLNYMLLALKLLGLIHKRKPERRVTKSILYSLLINLILWANFVFFFYAYSDTWKFGSQLFYRITIHLWFGQLALIHTVYFFQVSPTLPSFLKKWNRFAYNHHCQTAEQARGNSNRAMVAGISYSLAFNAAGLAFGIIAGARDGGNHYIDDILNLKESHLALKVIILISQALFALIWVVPIAFLYAISATISFNFQRITELLRAVLHEPDTTRMGEAIELLRNRHQQLCRVVKDLDGMYSVCMLSVYITCIPVICLATYNLAFNAYDGMSLVVFEALTMFISIITQMGFVTSSVSAITVSANSPTEELFDFQIAGNSADLHRRAFQVSIFIQRITHCHIGLTAWNLFNVNKQTVFMLTSMILSYVFVLFKLGLSLEQKDIPGVNATMH